MIVVVVTAILRQNIVAVKASHEGLVHMSIRGLWALPLLTMSSLV